MHNPSKLDHLLMNPQPPRFVPAIGLHSFWWNGTRYGLHRKQESIFDDGASSGFSSFKDREDLIISCLGRNPGRYSTQHNNEVMHPDRVILQNPSSYSCDTSRSSTTTAIMPEQLSSDQIRKICVALVDVIAGSRSLIVPSAT